MLKYRENGDFIMVDELGFVSSISDLAYLISLYLTS